MVEWMTKTVHAIRQNDTVTPIAPGMFVLMAAIPLLYELKFNL